MTTDVITTIEEITSAPVGEILSEITEEATTIAGVWGSMGGTTEMSFLDTLSMSLIGFAIVFLVLGFLAVFVFGMGKVFDALNKKSENKTEAVPAPSAPAAATGTPLPENQTIGSLSLINVTEEEAVVIMAITSDKTKIPLNRLQFNSIKLLED